ncbi:MAG TPA: hypothetical protein VFG50_13600 [Rhodothermales bacterium]|nr:hypothetical protein [Rhodothermales bacterium]
MLTFKGTYHLMIEAMPDTTRALQELREAERHLNRAIREVGMERGKRGYIAPTIADALESVREAITNIDTPAARRRSWPRLARAA